MNCFGCGAEKDPRAKERYPYEEDGLITDEPIPPLFVIDCQPSRPEDGFRAVVVCGECFHRLNPDQWISEESWRALRPLLAFEDLPLKLENTWEPEQYADVQSPKTKQEP